MPEYGVSRKLVRAMTSLLPMLTLLGCTPHQEQKSTVTFQFSAQAVKQYSIASQDVRTFGWAISDPTTIGQIVCYAVGVSGPEAALQSRECHDSNGVTVFR